jgi:hypothetical protein
MRRTNTFLSVLLLALFACSCEEQRTPEKFLIPSGYVGWVRIEYSVPTEPPLPVEAGYQIIRIPQDGLLKTSSKLEVGWAMDYFYYCDGPDCRELADTTRGKGGMIWGAATGRSQRPPDPEKVFMEFFVGTEDEFDRYGTPPAGGEIRIGNLARPAPK